MTLRYFLKHLHTGFNLVKLISGIKHAPGNMFTEIPNGDAIFMKVKSYISHSINKIQFWNIKVVIKSNHNSGSYMIGRTKNAYKFLKTVGKVCQKMEK